MKHRIFQSTKPLQEWICQIFDNAPSKVLFRVDAGRVGGLSFGHVSRCLILSNVLQEQFDTKSLFLMRDYEEGIAYIKATFKHIQTIPLQLTYELESQAIQDNIEDFQPDWLIIDLPYYDLNLSYLSQIRGKNVKVLFIDDSRYKVPPVDVYLNSSILAKKEILQPPEKSTKFFLGPEYFIFDENLLSTGIIYKNKYFNIAVTFGGSDPTGLTLKVLKSLLAKNWPEFCFWIIMGPGYKDVEQTEVLIKDRINFQTVRNPGNLISYLQGCDFAICAGGRTMYELIYMGKSFFPIPSAKHEEAPVNEVRRLKLNMADNNHSLMTPIISMLSNIEKN